MALSLMACSRGVDVAVFEPPSRHRPQNTLAIHLSRAAYEAVQVEWSDDPDVHQFTVERDGATLANVMSTSLIDQSVTTDVRYRYRVSDYSLKGDLIAISDTTCIVLAP